MEISGGREFGARVRGGDFREVTGNSQLHFNIDYEHPESGRTSWASYNHESPISQGQHSTRLKMGFFQRFRRVSTDPIKHVVVLMLENHSFDQMLGCCKAIYPHLEGVDQGSPRSNIGLDGIEYRQQESYDLVVDPDPMHEFGNIERQLAGDNGGFVAEYQRTHPEHATLDPQKIMNYFALDALPALHTLAREFAICDHWFSSVPGPTWTNRFFVHSGTSLGLVEMPTSVADTHLYLHYRQDTIFDRLNERGIKWRVYFGDVPQSLVLSHQRRPKNALRYRLMRHFYANTLEREEDFPQYCFIEPNYMKGEQNDDHPAHSTMRAQRLVAKIYNAIRKNQRLWESTLLVVLYDEHGGFYDHVSPPHCVSPDNVHTQYDFARLGPRVPALLISPWIDKQVVSNHFDHTSLIKYLIEKWDLSPLTRRVDEARSFGDVIRRTGRPRTDTPATLPVPALAMAIRAEELPDGASNDVTAAELAEPENDLQRSLGAFAEHLEEETHGPKIPQALMAAGPYADGELAKRRVEGYLNQQAENAVD
jgi:phospholipase C